jgi:hypothetical protein
VYKGEKTSEVLDVKMGKKTLSYVHHHIQNLFRTHSVATGGSFSVWWEAAASV